MPDGDVAGCSIDGVLGEAPDRIIWHGARAIICFKVALDGLANLIGHGPVEQARSTLEPVMKILWQVDLCAHDHNQPHPIDVYTAYIINRHNAHRSRSVAMLMLSLSLP